jgi:hypothetical protein
MALQPDKEPRSNLRQGEIEVSELEVPDAWQSQSPADVRLDEAKALMRRFYPDKSDWPKGMLGALWRAISRAELRGYADCLRFFDVPDPICAKEKRR